MTNDPTRDDLLADLEKWESSHARWEAEVASSEAEYDAMFSPAAKGFGKFEHDVADFKRAGLLPDIAEKAARALKAGTYVTFEEAALMCSPLTQAHGSRLGRVDAGVLATIVKERV